MLFVNFTENKIYRTTSLREIWNPSRTKSIWQKPKLPSTRDCTLFYQQQSSSKNNFFLIVVMSDTSDIEIIVHGRFIQLFQLLQNRRFRKKILLWTHSYSPQQARWKVKPILTFPKKVIFEKKSFSSSQWIKSSENG